ncbi:hypothetical protein Tco_0693030 [Tanacetum coccineum]
MHYPRFTKVIIHHFLIQDKTFSWRNKIRMHTSKDDCLINTLRFVSRKEASQIYGALLPDCLTSPEMKESKAYKTYLSYATSVVPPKIAKKFKKASPSKKDSVPVQADEEPVQKGKRVKRSAKKSSTTPAAGIVIRETPVKTKSTGKEKVDVSRGKCIELLSEVALAEKAQLLEVRKKSLRYYHKTYPSGSCTVAEKPLSVEKITPTVTSEGTGDKPGVPDVAEDDSTESESESWGNDEDDNNDEQESKDEISEHENESEEQESDDLEQEDESDDDDQEEEDFVHTPSPTDDKDDDNLESESDDVIKSDEEKGMDDTKEVVQGEGADAEMHDAQQGNENLETTQEQVVEDAHVTISTVTKKTEVPVTSSSLSSDLASKFLNFLDIPQADAEIVSPLDVHVHHEVPRTEAPTLLSVPVSVIPESSPVFTNIPQSSHIFTPTPIQATHTPPPTIETTNPLSTLPDFSSVFRFNDRITALEKEVVELKKDPLHTQVTSLVDSHFDTRLGETRDEFEVSNFAPPVIEKLIKESRDEVTLAKVSSQPHSTYEVAYTLTEFELKEILIDKMEKSQKKKDSTSGSSKGTKSQPKSSGKSIQLEEPMFEVADSDMPQDQEGNLGDNKDEPRKETTSRCDWFKKPTPPQEPTDPDYTLIDFSGYIMNGLKIKNLTQEILLGPALRLLKGTRTNYAELEYDFEECYKALSEKLDWENPEGGDYLFDLSKPLHFIMRGNHQRVPVEYFINNDLKYLQGGVSTMTYTTSTTKTKAAQYDLSGIEDMREQRKSFYAYARGMQSRGDVYSTKRILAVTHVKVIRKHGYGYLEEIVVRRADNVLYRFKEGDFPRLRINDIEDMLILVKRVGDLQLGVESYQKKINVTKPDTTRPDLRKRHPYTPYKDPQGFIYVDDFEKNRLMRSDELYKFSDGTLTRLLSSLEDITKNIDMENLPKRRCSTLEKKRAHFMIKDINKLLKERRMMRSLEKFIGGRLYGTDLRLLQRTI